jgi:nicotinate-nucleotide pyrophosphorylase (carboxylating)
MLEASGGITPHNVADYAAAGVDILSLGYLTHSSKWLNFSLEVQS